jgi:hypothetical protein
MDTMLLTDDWDLALTPGGDMALAKSKFPDDHNGPPAVHLDASMAYGQAQDAASQLKLFQGELYYDTGQGIPYWQQILGYIPQTPLIKAKYEQAASLVPGVVAVNVQIESVVNRTIVGTVFITNDLGVAASARFR